MSDTNRVGMRYARTALSEFPIDPAPSRLHQIRYTQTPSLAFAPQTVQSAEIRADRQISDLALIGGQAAGDVDFELSTGAFDPFLESALFGTWVDPPVAVGGDIQTIELSGANTQITLDVGKPFVVNHLVQLKGVDGVGAGIFRVSAHAGNVLTLVAVDASNVASGVITINAGTRLAAIGVIAPAAGNLDIDVTGGVLTIDAGAVDSFNNLMSGSSTLVPGQWVKIAGAATTGNNVWIRLTEVTTRQLKGVAPTGAQTEAVTGQLIVYFGGYVRNGTVAIADHTYLLERRYQDHTPVEREVFVGMVLDQLQLTLEQSAIVTGKTVWSGNLAKIDSVLANLFAPTPTDEPAPTGEVLNTANNVARLGLGADQIDQGGVNAVLSAGLSLANNLRRQGAVRHFGAVGVGTGALVVTGTLTTYFDNRENLNRLLNNEESSVDFVLRDNDNAGLVLDMPRIKFSGGSPEVAGQNQDVTLALTYQALRAAAGYTIHIQRSEYAT